ncbi:MAG: hypothetical protein LC800_05545 [Acidobacteria bacterium]|nr:hypothetical protein [Acidobacteriota bacterium]
MQQHITILGWLYIIFGALGIMMGLLILLGAGIAGAAAGAEGEAGAGLLAGGIGFVIAAVVALISLPNILAGWGLLKGKSWSRILAIVLGAISLLSIPIGTILGVYTIWALTKPESQSLLRN